jgi:hypothetical protein
MQDSNLSWPSSSRQSIRPKRPASKDITNYLEPEVAKKFDTSKGKTLRSGKVTFSEPVNAKQWTAAAKSAKANLKKILSPLRQFIYLNCIQLNNKLTLPQNSTTAAK